MLFECCRTQVAESRMATTQIVETFDGEEDVVTRSTVRSVGLLPNQLGLEHGPEALHQSVVVTVVGAAYANLHLGGLQASLVVVAGILAAAVGMVKQPRWRSACDQRRIQRALGSFTCQGCLRRPPCSFPRKDIHDCFPIKPPFICGNGGDVSNPLRIGASGPEVLLKHVLGCWQLALAVCGAETLAPFVLALQGCLAHQLRHPPPATAYPLRLQLSIDAQTPVTLATRYMHKLNHLARPFILLLATAGLAFPPGVIRAGFSLTFHQSGQHHNLLADGSYS
jgi:hypothetical protein